MNLDRVTITGADDSVKTGDLLAISREYPFLELGILVSASNAGAARFPSVDWLLELRGLARQQNKPWPLSLHVCGRWVRQMLIGETPSAIWTLIEEYQRVQLNFHAEKTECVAGEFLKALLAFTKDFEKQFIFQIDGAKGNAHLESLYAAAFGAKENIDAVPLFDISGGAGILPIDGWPTPICYGMGDKYTYHGYAGGLGPDNLQEQIPLIGKAAGDCRVWLDMETRVRSDDDRQFDLDKVRRCLEIAKPFVTTG